jgi:GH25 family lysozyme M1 (1,4-beta-N-acetylmuramidase)
MPVQKKPLRGIDVSHHNKYKIPDFSKQDFVIMKATEGKSFVDPMLNTYIEMLKPDQLYGFYHFARPERNRAKDEALHFCNTIGKYGEEAILVLDWEALAVQQPIEWALEWCKEVEKIYGKKPLIYCSSWYTKKCRLLLQNDIGLWVAHYTKKDKPTIYTYPTYALWQYTSEPYDKDVFNGTRKQWELYARRK